LFIWHILLRPPVADFGGLSRYIFLPAAKPIFERQKNRFFPKRLQKIPKYFPARESLVYLAV
jgi:hypothetical protein